MGQADEGGRSNGNPTAVFSFSRVTHVLGDDPVPEKFQLAFHAAWERVFTARDVQEAAGLSSRQLNDWDVRGALPHERGADAGWRRFTARDLFILMTCAALRRQFGVSVDRIRYVQQFMLQDGADHLEAAIHLMSTLGVGVWLLTDFEKTFVMDSELEFQDLWQHGYFGGSASDSYALLKINPIVNQFLGCRTGGLFLPEHGRGYEIMQEMRSAFGVKSPEEFEVLQMIRGGDFERVEIKSLKGEIQTIRATSYPDPDANLDDIRREHPYLSLTVVQRDGRTVSIEQTTTIKPNRKKPVK